MINRYALTSVKRGIIDTGACQIFIRDAWFIGKNGIEVNVEYLNMTEYTVVGGAFDGKVIPAQHLNCKPAYGIR